MQTAESPMNHVGAMHDPDFASQPDLPFLWLGSGAWTVDVGSRTELEGWIAGLDDQDFGVLRTPSGDRGRWGQTMHVGDWWIVEVSDESGNDMARRVYRRAGGAYPEGPTARRLYDCEVWIAADAAHLLWAWLHGGLPEGCARTLYHYSASVCAGWDLVEEV